MRAASNRGLSARTIALGTVAILAGLAALNRQRALDAQRRYPPRGDFIRVRGVRLHKIDTGGPGPAPAPVSHPTSDPYAPVPSPYQVPTSHQPPPISSGSRVETRVLYSAFDPHVRSAASVGILFTH